MSRFQGFLALAFAFTTSVTFAQAIGNTGGQTGNSAIGGSSAASAVGGGGGSNVGGAGLGGNTGAVQGPQFNSGDGSLGDQVGQNGFIGRNDNTDRFIGSQMAGQGTGAVQRNNYGSLGGRRSTGGNQSLNVSQILIRPRIRVSFDVPLVPVQQVEQRVSKQLVKLPVPNVEGVQVQLDERGTAFLSGKVATEHEKKLVEAFVRLEPGVWGIENQIEIVPAAEN
ncbi:MAG: BON domain-containing protein [Planctomycetaceae bacterium]